MYYGNVDVESLLLGFLVWAMKADTTKLIRGIENLGYGTVHPNLICFIRELYTLKFIMIGTAAIF